MSTDMLSVLLPENQYLDPMGTYVKAFSGRVTELLLRHL